MNVGEIVYKVRAAIGEVVDLENPKALESVNADNLLHIIVDKIPYAFEWVIQNAPLSLLEGGLTSRIEQSVMSTRIGRIELPDDILRIISARMSSWTYAPPISDEHSEVAMQQRYPSTRGTYDAPACVLYSEDNKQVLKMFSAETVADKVYITFIRKPETLSVDPVDLTEVVKVPPRLEASFIYYISALTMQALGEASQPFFEIATLNLKKNE